MSSNVIYSYIATRNLTHISGFFCEMFVQPISSGCPNCAYFDIKSHLIFSSETAKPNLTGMILFSSVCPFKMVAVTNNRNVFNVRWLL